MTIPNLVDMTHHCIHYTQAILFVVCGMHKVKQWFILLYVHIESYRIQQIRKCLYAKQCVGYIIDIRLEQIKIYLKLCCACVLYYFACCRVHCHRKKKKKKDYSYTFYLCQIIVRGKVQDGRLWGVDGWGKDFRDECMY